MAQLVIAAAGAALGSLAGPGALLWGMSGAQLGWMAGSMLGSALAPKNHQSGPRLDELRVTGTEYGGGIAWIAGAPRVAGDLIWASDRREIATTEEVGKGGGSDYTTYSYEIDAMYLLADQPGAIVTRCWDNGKLIWTNLASADDDSRLASEQTTKWRRITVYDGADTQMPDPTYEAAVTNAPAYTRRLCVFIEGLQLGNSGALPNLTWEVASVGDSNPNFVRRYEVANTGWQFADQYSDALGRPALLSIAPTVRVATLTDAGTEVYVFNLQGDADGTSSRTTAENYPSVYYYPGTYDGSSAPVGIMDGLPVRVANHFYALGGAARHIRAGAKTGAAWDVGILPDLALCLPSGRYLGDTIPCSDGVHLLVFTAPTSAYFGTAVLNRWHIIRRNGLLGELVSEGDIDPPRTWMAYGSSGVNFSAAMMEDDLQHVWFAYGAGEGTLTMLKIEPDGVMRDRSSMRFALLSYGFTFPAIWAEGSFCVVVSRQSYQAFRRAGDVIDQVPLQDVVEALCDRATMPAGTYDASALAAITQPVRALAVTGGSARQALEILQASHGFDAHCTDKLYFVPRGGASVVTIDADDLAAGEGDASGEPFALTVNADLEMPSRIAVSYKNMLADQITGVEHSDRGPAGQDSIQQMQLAIGMTPSEAKGVADAMVRDAYAARITSTLSLPMAYTHLTPTDVIQVPGGDGSLYRMRITRRSDSGGVMALDVVGDDGEVVIESMTTSTDYIEQTTVSILADTLLEILDIPLLRDADDSQGVYVAARGISGTWPGCIVYRSRDGVTYGESVADIREAAVMGTASTALPAWSRGAIADRSSTLTVSVADGQLSSATFDQLQADVSLNALLVGDEVIRFATAVLQSANPNVYLLSGLFRGQRGTEWAAGSHIIGERVVLLSMSGLRRIALSASDIGQVLYFKGVTKGGLADDATVESLTFAGVSQKPLAPVDPRGTRDANGTIELRWKRRTRLATNFTGTAGFVVPLGESAELYEVEIWDSGYTTKKRTIQCPSGAVAAYSWAQQYADFAAAQTTIYARIFQMSGGAVRGYQLQSAVAVPVYGSPSLQPKLITASASGWIAWSTRRESSGAPGVVDDVLVVSWWSASSPGGPYTIAREASYSGLATLDAPAHNGAIGRQAHVAGSLLQVQFAVGAMTPPRFILTPLDLASAPSVVTPSISFVAPRNLVQDGSRVLLFGEGNQVYESADGFTWSALGAMAGATFPFLIGGEPLVSHTITKIGTRFFLIFGAGGAIATTGGVFYTDHADARTGWTAASGITVNGTSEALHGEVAFDGSKHYIGRTDDYFGTTTVFASTDGGATWSAEYTTDTNTGFEVTTAGGTGAFIRAFHVTGTTGSDKVRFYTSNGVTFEKTVGTTTWTAKASGLTNPQFAVEYGGQMVFWDGGAVYTFDGSRLASETAGVFTTVSGL